LTFKDNDSSGDVPTAQSRDLETISLKDLESFKVCPGDIFFSPKRGNPIRLLRAGNAIYEEFIDKYKIKGLQSFKYLPMHNQKFISECHELLMQLKLEIPEEQRLLARESLVKIFYDHYWEVNEESNLLDLVIVCANTFLRFKKEIIEELQDTSLLFYNRSLKVASFSIIVAITLGYYDHDFLSDIYHTSFLLDYGLSGEKFTYHIVQACELERLNPGGGIAYLDDMGILDVGVENEIDIFLNHPKKGLEKARIKCNETFHYPESLYLIEKHHESGNGKGFPGNLKGGELTDFDCICVFTDQLVPFRDDPYKKGDGSGFIKNQVNAITREKSSLGGSNQRLLSRLDHEFKKMEKKKSA